MRDFNTLNLLAGKTRHFNSWLLLAREQPFPAQNPQARPSPPPPTPPPQQLRQWRRGEGAGSYPARPCILNRYFYFHSLYMNGYISLYDTTYMHSIQSGLINKSITILLLGEGIIAREGVRSQSPLALLKGMFCMNCDYRRSVGSPY
jgi:hypothetical protein